MFTTLDSLSNEVEEAKDVIIELMLLEQIAGTAKLVKRERERRTASARASVPGRPIEVTIRILIVAGR